jgi:hypothetical protein
MYAPLHDPAGFASLFGSPAISVAVFDRWFRARRLEIDQEMELLEANLRECPMPVEATGHAVVDHWVSETRRSSK